MNGSQATLPSLERRPLQKSFEQTPRARGSAARAVPLTQGDNVLFELFSPSVRGRAARSAAGGLFNHSNESYAKASFPRRGKGWLLKMQSNLIFDRVAHRFEKRRLRASMWRLRNFTNHPYTSLERR